MRDAREIAFKLGFRIAALLSSLFLTVPAGAYDFPLSETAVRDAYFLGCSTDRQKTLEFLGQYLRRFKPQSGGPSVGEIELRTPYAQVVSRSWENRTIGYSAQQAQVDYNARPGLVEVRVLLFVGVEAVPADLYSDSKGRILDRRENFWREFKFIVTQEHAIEPKKISVEPVYSTRGKGLQGSEVILEFDALEFASGETRIEAIAPNQQKVVADFGAHASG